MCSGLQTKPLKRNYSIQRTSAVLVTAGQKLPSSWSSSHSPPSHHPRACSPPFSFALRTVQMSSNMVILAFFRTPGLVGSSPSYDATIITVLQWFRELWGHYCSEEWCSVTYSAENHHQWGSRFFFFFFKIHSLFQDGVSLCRKLFCVLE